jgi:hypothetical protein
MAKKNQYILNPEGKFISSFKPDVFKSGKGIPETLIFDWNRIVNVFKKGDLTCFAMLDPRAKLLNMYEPFVDEINELITKPNFGSFTPELLEFQERWNIGGIVGREDFHVRSHNDPVIKKDLVLSFFDSVNPDWGTQIQRFLEKLKDDFEEMEEFGSNKGPFQFENQFEVTQDFLDNFVHLIKLLQKKKIKTDPGEKILSSFDHYFYIPEYDDLKITFLKSLGFKNKDVMQEIAYQKTDSAFSKRWSRLKKLMLPREGVKLSAAEVKFIEKINQPKI